MKHIPKWLWGILFLLWIALSVSAFYIVPEQRPLTPAHQAMWQTLLEDLIAGDVRFVGNLGRAALIWLRGLGGALAICGGALSAGLSSLHIIGWRLADEDHADPARLFLTGATLGLGIIGAAMLVVGMLGGAVPWGALAVLIASWAAAPRRTGRLLRALWQARERLHSTLGRALFLFALLTLSLALIPALLPPIDWDGIFYHLTGPKIAIHQGRIGWMNRYVPHFNFPWLGEALFLQALLLTGEPATKLLHWWAAVLIIGWIAWLARRRLGADGVPWAVALFLGMPMVSVLAGWAYTDLFLTLFVVAETALLAEAFAEEHGPAWYLLAGAMGGFATGVKYTAVAWPVVGLLLVIAYDLRASEGRQRRRLSSITWAFLLGGFCAGLLWPLKNLLLTSNPVYPFVFGGPEWDAVRMAWYSNQGTGIWGDGRAIALLPLELTMGIRDMNFYDGRTGPLWLVLLPLAIAWVWRRFRLARRPAELWSWIAVLALSGVHAAGWVWGVLNTQSLYQSRLLLPALAAFAWIAAVALLSVRHWRIGPVSPYNFIKLLTALILLSNLIYQVSDVVAQRPWRYLLGVETRDEYLDRELGIYWDAIALVNELPADARVLFLWEPRSYHAKPYVDPDAILDRWHHLYQTEGSADAIAHALYHESQISHILLYDYGMQLVRDERVEGAKPTPAAWAAWDDFADRWLLPLEEAPGYVLYTWRAIPAP